MKGRKLKIKKPKPKGKVRKYESWPSAENKKIIAQVKDLIEPLCEAEGMELAYFEYQREAGGKILRLYIDKPGGVTLDDCVHISRQSGDLLDVYLENAGPYSLEVSSPGQNRLLGKKLDFERFKGNRVNIKTTQPVDGKKKFKGVLMGISEEIVKLSVDDKRVAIPYQEITMARLAD